LAKPSTHGGWPNAVAAVPARRSISQFGLQVLARRAQRLLGEQERLEPDLRGAVDQREGVGQGEEDEVVARPRVLQERPPVVDMGRHPPVLVGVVGVVLTPELQDAGVDLDGVHVPGALPQGDGHVGAGPRADHQHVVEVEAR
jgi:hypothetical protein